MLPSTPVHSLARDVILRALRLLAERLPPVAARQWIADAGRLSIVWTDVPRPVGWTGLELAVAAGVVELLASRADQTPPSWTATIREAPAPVYLVRAAETPGRT